MTDDFSDYVTERRHLLLRAARAIATDHTLAEDLLQAALLQVGARWEGLRDRGAADAYVRRTMRNLQVSWYREGWRRLEVVTDRPVEPAPDEVTDPESHDLWPLVAALPTGQRAAVALRFYEGLSVAETAAVLGCSAGTVRSSTSRGLASLRRSVIGTADAA